MQSSSTGHRCTTARTHRRPFVNYGAVILDVGRVEIGDDVQIGPNVQRRRIR